MTRSAACLAVLALAAACGGGGGGGDSQGPPTPPPGGGSTTPPPPPADGGEKSAWPLTAGSRWTYQIDDPVRGRSVKHVEVIGAEAVPGSGEGAVRVRDVEEGTPPTEESSWQVEADGLVSRLREEDRRNGVLVRTTTFAPGGPKALSRAFPAGWTRRIEVTEITDVPGAARKAVPKVYEWRVVAERETVRTPAGTFEALRVERARVDPHNNPEPVKTYWFTPGVGKVREESAERTEELTAYDVR